MILLYIKLLNYLVVFLQIFSRLIGLELHITQENAKNEIKIKVNSSTTLEYLVLDYSTNNWSSNISLIFEISSTNFINKNLSTVRQSNTSQSDSVSKCLESANCYSIKTDGKSYFSYSNTEFNSSHPGIIMCDENDCSIMKFYTTENGKEVNIHLLIPLNKKYQFKVKQNLNEPFSDSIIFASFDLSEIEPVFLNEADFLERDIFLGDSLPIFKFSFTHLYQHTFYIDFGDDENKVQLTDFKVFDKYYMNGPSISATDAFSSIATLPTSSNEEYVALSTFTSDLSYLKGINIVAENPGTVTIKILVFNFCNSLETCSSYLLANPQIDEKKFYTKIAADVRVIKGFNKIEFDEYSNNIVVPRNSCITWSTQDTAAIEADNTIGSSSPPDFKLTKSDSKYNFQKIQVANKNTIYFLSVYYERCMTRYEYNSASYSYAMIGLFRVSVSMSQSYSSQIIEFNVQDNPDVINITCTSSKYYMVNESIICPMLISLPFEYKITYHDGLKFFDPNFHEPLVTASAKNYTRFFGELLVADSKNSTNFTKSSVGMYMLASCEFEFATKISGFHVIATQPGSILVQIYKNNQCPTTVMNCSNYARNKKIMFKKDVTLIHQEQLNLTTGLNKKLIVCDKLFPKGSFVILTMNESILAVNTSARIDDLSIGNNTSLWTFTNLHSSKSYRFAFKVRLDVQYETKRGNFSYYYSAQGFYKQSISLLEFSINLLEKQFISYYRVTLSTTITIAEDGTASINCGTNKIIILIEQSFNNTNCSSSSTTKAIENICYLRKSCHLTVNNNTFGKDPCFMIGSNNYLTLVYECMERTLVRSSYLGCYNADLPIDQNIDLQKNDTSIQLGDCSYHCGQFYKFNYMTVKDGNTCRCHDTFIDETQKVSADKCSTQCNSDLMACGGANYVTTYELVYFDTCFEKIELEYWNSLNTNYLINRRKNCLVYDSQAVTQNTILGCMSFNKVKTQLENSHYIEVSPPANISVTDCIKICTTIRYDFAILVGADKFNRCICEPQYNSLGYLDSVLKSECSITTNDDRYIVYEVNYYINLACSSYNFYLGTWVLCAIKVFNTNYQIVNYIVSDTLSSVSVPVVITNPYHFWYMFYHPGYYSMNATVNNLFGQSSKTFFIKSKLDLKNVQADMIRCRFSPDPKKSFYKLLYSMDNWISTNYFEINTTNSSKYSLQSSNANLCTYNCTTVNSSCLLANKNGTICTYQSSEETMNFFKDDGTSIDLFLVIAYDIRYNFKIQASYDTEWLDLTEIQTIIINAPTIENSYYDFYCSDGSLIYEPIYCYLRTDFTYSISMNMSDFPNTVSFDHSNGHVTSISSRDIRVNSTGEYVTRTDFFHYTLPGTYTIRINVHKSHQIVLLSNKMLFTKTYIIKEINQFTWDNLATLSSPIAIDFNVTMKFSVRIYAKKDFYIQFGDDTNSELVANYSTTEGNLLKLGPSVNSSTGSGISVDYDNTKEYLLLNSIFTERVYIKEVSVYANISGLVEFSVWKVSGLCNDSKECAEYFNKNPFNNGTGLVRKYSFQESLVIGYNKISLNSIEVLADFPGFLSWKSIGGSIAIDPIGSNLTDLSMNIDINGVYRFEKITTDPSHFLVMITVRPYLLKLEYSVSKTYWHTGEFNVFANLLGYSQVYMGRLSVYDEADDVRLFVNCSNTKWLNINSSINCSIDVLQPYPFDLNFYNDSARSNTTISPNIKKTYQIFKGSYQLFFGRLLIADVNQQPPNQYDNINYLLLSSEFSADVTIKSIQFISLTSGYVRVLIFTYKYCGGRTSLSCQDHLQKNPAILWSSENIINIYSRNISVNAGLNTIKITSNTIFPKGCLVLLQPRSGSRMSINSSNSKFSDYIGNVKSNSFNIAKINETINMTVCFKIFVVRNYYKNIQDVFFNYVRNGIYDFRLSINETANSNQSTQLFQYTYRVIEPGTVEKNQGEILQIDCNSKLIYLFSTYYGNEASSCFLNGSLTKVKNECYLKKTCNILVSNNWFNVSDLCPGQNLKLTVVYECIERVYVRSKYIGCYAENSTKYLDQSTSETITALTPNLCSQKCSNHVKYDYFGLMEANTCTCGTAYWEDAKTGACKCDKKCVGDSNEICGGNQKNSLFKNVYLDMCYREIKDEYWDGFSPEFLIDKNPECYPEVNGTYNLIGCYDYAIYSEVNLDKFCFKGDITIDQCREKCRRLQLKYAGISGSSKFDKCYCDDDYNRQRRYTHVLNQTDCDQIPRNAKYVIYELIYSINLKCPTQAIINEVITCNLTMNIPNINMHNLIITQNSSLNGITKMSLNNNFTQLLFEFDEPGIYEVKVTEELFGSSSSKMINVSDYMIRKRLIIKPPDSINLSCDPGLVNIIYAAYGNKDYNCLTQNSTTIARNFCYLKKNCTVSASVGVFGNSPCGTGTQNFLYMHYNCSARAYKKHNYLGCYKDSNSSNLELKDLWRAHTTNSSMSTEYCIKYCSDLNFDYAGTQNTSLCFCHDSYGSFGKENDTCKCDRKCAGDNTQMCGGYSLNSIYEILYIDNCYKTIEPSYWTNKNQALLEGHIAKCSNPLPMNGQNLIGCFYINDMLDLNRGNQDYCMKDPTTEDACFDRCASMGYKYASYNFLNSLILSCMCDNKYNIDNYLTTILNTTNCSFISGNAFESTKQVIYELVYTISLECPMEIFVSYVFTCNVTMYNSIQPPNPTYHDITVKFSNNSNHKDLNMTFRTSFIQFNESFSTHGVFEITVIDNFSGLNSSKLITSMKKNEFNFEATKKFFESLFSNPNSSTGQDPISALGDSNPKMLLDMLSLPGQDMSGCLSNCSNRGKCSINDDNKFVCICDKFFIGDSCQKDVRACSKNPCQNDGKCTEVEKPGKELNDFACNCSSPFYSGLRCEIKFNVCWNKTCNMNGKCFNNNTIPTCNCFKFYLGANCEIKSESLQAMKKTAAAASTIAITVVGGFYLAVLVADYLKYCHVIVTAIVKSIVEGATASGGAVAGATASGATASGATASGGTASGGTASGGTASGGTATGAVTEPPVVAT